MFFTLFTEILEFFKSVDPFLPQLHAHCTVYLLFGPIVNTKILTLS